MNTAVVLNLHATLNCEQDLWRVFKRLDNLHKTAHSFQDDILCNFVRTPKIIIRHVPLFTMMNKTIHSMFSDTLASLASPSSVDTDQLSSLGVRLKVRIPSLHYVASVLGSDSGGAKIEIWLHYDKAQGVTLLCPGVPRPPRWLGGPGARAAAKTIHPRQWLSWCLLPLIIFTIST